MQSLRTVQKFSLDIKAYVILSSFVLVCDTEDTGIFYINQKLVNNFVCA